MTAPGDLGPITTSPFLHDYLYALNLSTLAYPGNLTYWSGDDNTTATWEEEDIGGGRGGGGPLTTPAANWWGLVALLVVLLTLFGNILLILAISWDRRLQNMTNYFLLSLAVTDLMVASLVMPLSIVVLILGHFPFSSELCLLWISLDVLFCTASIMHLCTLSVDRFLSLRYPMKFGRHKTRRRVVLKIVLVWCLSLAASLPLSLMYATDPHSTIVDGVCQIPVSLFQIIASVICFYIPLIIMLVTYALTARLLSKKQSELQGTVLESSSASPSPRSVRWKKLLCKTTSNLSTSTAVSLTDGEISEGGCSRIESRCEEGKLRRFGSSPLRRPPLVRYTSHHYRAALARGGGTGVRGYSTRDLKVDGNSGGGTEDRLFPHLPTSPGYELSVFPQAPCSAPTSTTTSPLHIRHRDADVQSQPDAHPSCTLGEEGNKDPQGHALNSSCEQNGDPRRRGREECGEECEGGDSSRGHVAVPCSCAPRFFLEDVLASSDSQCDECSDPRPQEVAPSYRNHQHRRSQDSRQRRRGGGCCPMEEGGRRWCCPCLLTRLSIRRLTGSQCVELPLSSPWHEGASPPDLVTRTTLQVRGSGDDVATQAIIVGVIVSQFTAVILTRVMAAAVVFSIHQVRLLQASRQEHKDGAEGH
uniref:Serotonin receptor type 2B n=1 Tax=Homarus americanus TaxID=6706 RepID=A0A1B3P5V2_HOMAM|nr:serotonin receptor type 2B [Homarus americanus]